MHPPDSYNPYQPPAYGQQTPGQYAARYPGQYPPAYPYPYPYPPPPPEKGLSTRTIVLIVVVVVVLLVLIPVILAGVLVFYLQSLPASGGNVDTNLGIMTDTTPIGDWMLTITYGSQPASSLTLHVTNSSTGQTVLTKNIPSIKYPTSDPDAIYNDNNGNNKVDAGDSIILKASGGHVQVGDMVRILKGESIVGTVIALHASAAGR